VSNVYSLRGEFGFTNLMSHFYRMGRLNWVTFYCGRLQFVMAVFKLPQVMTKIASKDRISSKDFRANLDSGNERDILNLQFNFPLKNKYNKM